MSIKFEKIVPGMTLYDYHKQRMGNTMMSRMGCWHVRVKSVNAKKRTAIVSWNSNPDEEWFEYQLTRLCAKKKANPPRGNF